MEIILDRHLAAVEKSVAGRKKVRTRRLGTRDHLETPLRRMITANDFITRRGGFLSLPGAASTTLAR
jgi:hypothetical protein